ncbi:carbohydrate porin [Franconibacter helveticus]|uniref:carbohydrate porin n=1 Tax=Franconibacter helveticus TaxID=357240 RepID=UPI00066DF56F|nr:carbohydrate porin [Franconibacter helveticus]
MNLSCTSTKNKTLFSLSALTLSLFSAGVAAQENKYSCEQLDKLNTRSQQVVTAPSICESLIGDPGGLRSQLADYGWGAQLSWNPTILYDLRDQQRDPQEYSGQNFTWSQSMALNLTYDLARIGFTKDAQFTFSAQWATSNYQAGYPRLHNVATLAINQPLLDGQVELQYGYYPLIRQFYGMILGGNSSSAALGPTSVIPVQVGISLNAPTPTFTFIARDSEKRFYNNFAVSRSMSPKGHLDDVEQNPWGLKWHVDGANPILVNEVGYKREAQEDARSLWFRAGGIYNTSHYDYFDKPGDSSDNYAFYVANTVQLTQPQKGLPLGLYLDTKVNYAPDDRNAYTSDFQVTLFDIGLFPGRPQDMTSLGYTRSFISKKFRTSLEPAGLEAPQSINAVSLSHALRLVQGIYWINGITWQDNPTLVPRRDDAVLFQSSMYWNF